MKKDRLYTLKTCKIFFIKLFKMSAFLPLKSLIIAIHFSGFGFCQGDLFMSGNNRPVANAGNDIKTISEGSIFLDASESYINDGSKLKYEWSFAPGLVPSNRNNFSSEIQSESWDTTYIRSVETYKQVLDVSLAKNNPGTKLEVILNVKNRIGFEASDTLIVEYYDFSESKETIPDTVLTVSDTLDTNLFNQDSIMLVEDKTVILIYGFSKNKIEPLDVQIINSFIIDQINVLGFDLITYSNNNFPINEKSKDYKTDCSTDSCVSENAQLIDAGYVISWAFQEQNGSLSIRIYDSEDFLESINSHVIPKLFMTIKESGVYGLEPDIRDAVSVILDGKQFKNNISRLDRFKMNNKQWIELGKYPVIAGVAYLLIDKILLGDEKSEAPELPPGFPHD